MDPELQRKRGEGTWTKSGQQDNFLRVGEDTPGEHSQKITGQTDRLRNLEFDVNALVCESLIVP